MPIRLVREGILTSKRMAQLGWAEEVFFRRLLSVVDDFGRYHADPGLLRAACYPRQLDKVSDTDIESWLLAALKADLVVVYEASDGEAYLQVERFGQQIRSKQSKFPGPDECAKRPLADAKQVLSTAHLDVDVFGDVFGDVFEDGDGKALGASPSPKPPPRDALGLSIPPEAKPKRPAPRRRLDVTVLPDAWREHCRERRPGLMPTEVFERFRDHHVAKGNAMADWDAAWRTWVSREGQFARAPPANPARDRRLAMGAAIPAPWAPPPPDPDTIDVVATEPDAGPERTT